ncbi:MAG: phosphate acetyltransferase [Cyclobacteriaceae bacterium]|nr:phosphate acetyltransferase [Cyclobacteriaceae bacterium]MDH5250198.1 phosphate acetyltransferase [Cyclobacteriaceae bacterium]
MTNAIYITTTEPYSGKSIIALGLVNLLAGKMAKIAYFKPVISCPPTEKDSHLHTIANHFNLNEAYNEMYVFTRDEVSKHINAGNESYIIDTIIERFKRLQENYDFVVVEGTDFMDNNTNLEFDGNISIVKNLGIPAVVIVKGEGKAVKEIVDIAVSTTKSFTDSGVQILTIVANKIDIESEEEIIKRLNAALPKGMIVTSIPGNKDLGSPTMQEIVESVKGKVLFGEHLLSNRVDASIVGAMQLHNCLTRINKNTLIATPGDRGDIIIGALQANISKNYSKIAGIVLTGGLVPEPTIMKLIEGLDTVVPIIQVDTGTFKTVTRIANTQSRISPENKEKINLAIAMFDKYVDVKALEKKIIFFRSTTITPRMFQYQIVKRAKEHRKHIVLPEGEDDRILMAADLLIKQNVVDLTILGNKETISAAVNRLNLSLDLEQVSIINPATSDRFEDFVKTLYDLRKHKGLTMEMARDLMQDVSYFGTMMVYKGEADGMVSGAVHTTQHTIRPALQFVKTKPGVNTVSSVFFMCLPNRVSVFGDCAVNPDPTSEQLADIAISSAETSRMFGIEPKVAMLSYSSGSSGEGADVDKVRKATEIIRLRSPDLKVEGPIQYDAAVDPVVGKKKLPNSEVAGQASVLIFPDLNTGNNTYKAVQRETGALAIGPMLQGLNKPVNDLSRGCTVADIFNTVVITAIQAQQ